VFVRELFFPSTKYSVKLSTRQFHVYFSQPISCIKLTLPAELKCYFLARSGDFSVGIETGLQSGKRGAVIRFLTEEGNFSLSKAFRAAVRGPAAFCLISTADSFSGVKGEERESDHSLSPNAAVNNVWRYTSAYPVILHGVHRDIFMPF
jgi:hypothetical protein